MGNPMMALLNKQTGAGTPDQMLKAVSALQAATGGNNNELVNHPLYKQASEIAARYNGDWMKAFTETAKANGIDPNMILSTMRSTGIC